MPKGAPRLTEDQQVFVVTRLACFARPGSVLAELKAEWGKRLDPRVDTKLIFDYDGGREYNRRKIAKKLVALFDETRAAFQKGAMEVPIANKTYRLQLLQRVAEKAEGMGNLPLAVDAATAAPKEVGGAYTNRREMTGPSGGPISTTCVLVEVPDGSGTALAKRQEIQ